VVVQTKLLGQMLYYILTTGAGQQTLGEEYCDIVQVFFVNIVYGSESSIGQSKEVVLMCV